MSVMFSSPGFIAMLFIGIILIGVLLGSIGWAIYHIASGKFHEEYEIATKKAKGKESIINS
ncbi:hypothetical protein [Caldalkalibacillus salinus]|uniref:hypothetical protein n=1 Tax=Caldalkalibacillus salinus TaxID=2803787 RepID=UPI0019226C16|nr:hypothetical protein [Caldalkalibacillus salinus]